jgi:hypothetical protein
VGECDGDHIMLLGVEELAEVVAVAGFQADGELRDVPVGLGSGGVERLVCGRDDGVTPGLAVLGFDVLAVDARGAPRG